MTTKTFTQRVSGPSDIEVTFRVVPLPEAPEPSPEPSPGVSEPSGFRFSQRSLDNLKGVHKDLQALAHRALELTTVDFTVIDGLRTREEQDRLVASGASQTMNSRHLTGHAIDVAPYVDGDISWDWDDYYPMADAFIQAAKELDIRIRWGGNWRVGDIRTWTGSARELNAQYSGNFPDGPHFEIPR